MSMTIDHVDYDGSSGLFIANGQEMLPLTSEVGAITLVGSCIQAGIGDSEQAAEAQALVDAALGRASTAAV